MTRPVPLNPINSQFSVRLAANIKNQVDTLQTKYDHMEKMQSAIATGKQRPAHSQSLACYM